MHTIEEKYVTGYFPDVKGTVGVKAACEETDPLAIVLPEGEERAWREQQRNQAGSDRYSKLMEFVAKYPSGRRDKNKWRKFGAQTGSCENK